MQEVKLNLRIKIIFYETQNMSLWCYRQPLFPLARILKFYDDKKYPEKNGKKWIQWNTQEDFSDYILKDLCMKTADPNTCILGSAVFMQSTLSQ